MPQRTHANAMNRPFVRSPDHWMPTSRDIPHDRSSVRPTEQSTTSRSPSARAIPRCLPRLSATATTSASPVRYSLSAMLNFACRVVKLTQYFLSHLRQASTLSQLKVLVLQLARKSAQRCSKYEPIHTLIPRSSLLLFPHHLTHTRLVRPLLFSLACSCNHLTLQSFLPHSASSPTDCPASLYPRRCPLDRCKPVPSLLSLS